AAPGGRRGWQAGARAPPPRPPWRTGSGRASRSRSPAGSPTGGGSRAPRHPRCWWRSCRGRRRRSPPRTPARAGAVSAAAGRGAPAAAGSSARGGRWRRYRSRSEAEASPVHLHAHPAGQLAAHDVHVVSEAGEGRPAERLLVDDLELGARRDPTLREVAKHVGVAVGDAHKATAGAGLERGERIGRQLDDLEVAARDRVAVGIALRIAELHRYQLLELLGE